jgi:multidrug efflux pump
MIRFNLSEWAITHRALVLFMILVLGGAGAYSYLNLGRAEDPSFTIKSMVVNVAWPGATATEMQTQVADKIEKKLQELPFLDRVETYSQPGLSFIQVYLIDRTPPAKVKDLWYQVRKKVGDIRGDLPPGVVGPNFNDEYGDVYSAIYMLSADGLSLAALKTRAEDIRQRLLRVPNVNKVDIIGERPQKIFIELNHAKLATLSITPQQIFDSVARQNAVTSGGAVDTSADRINLRVTGAFSGAEAIAAVPVQADGRVFRLGDIASVSRGYEDPATFIVREGGKPALGLGVSMQDGANIITLGEDLKKAMAAIIAELPVGIEVTQIADQAGIVEHSVSEFVETFVEALGIVLLVSVLRPRSILALERDRLEPVSVEIRTSLCSRPGIPTGNGLVRPETEPALLAITANSAWRRPASPAFWRAKSRKATDYSDRARKPELRGTAWWGW